MDLFLNVGSHPVLWLLPTVQSHASRVRSTGHSKLPIGVNACVCVCFSLSAL